MKKLLVLLAVVTSLMFIGVAQADNHNFYAEIFQANGTVCPASKCALVTVYQPGPDHVVLNGSNRQINLIAAWSYPAGGNYVPVGWIFENALNNHPLVNLTTYMNVYARESQGCSAGHFRYSDSRRVQVHAGGDIWWMGGMQVGGCR